MIKKYFIPGLLGLLMMIPSVGFAVTKQEMEQARTIAAKAYIRYVNDGSGYLDEINPTNLEELQSALKPKEKENIKAFLAIPVPSDYQSWDKQKLVDYWAGTAFQNSGLEEKGRGGRIRARAQINKMEIGATAAVAAETPAAPQPAPVAEEPKPAVEETPVETPVEQPQMTAEQVQEEMAAAEESIQEDLSEDELDIKVPEAYNYTWVYIMILGILVVVVIILVVYAAKVMKKDEGKTPAPGAPAGKSDSEVLANEKYESKIADKDFEIAMLTKKLEAANKQNSELKGRLESLSAEVSRLKERGNEAPSNISANYVQNVGNVTVATPSGSLTEGLAEAIVMPVGTKEEPAASKSPKGSLRSIFLGRANAKNIFVRADRTLNPGHSVFCLDTSDGFSGTFRVADSPEAWDLALTNPREYLMNACVGHDLEDTAGVSKIVTEDSGTAIFEGGCWRVIRKAKIRYE